MSATMTFSDAKQRFSNRAADYVRFRPGYPQEILEKLRAEFGLRANQVIADVGSGTGLLTKLFLENGNRVLGVEPNAEMREAGEEFLAAFPNFASVNGSAEATTLATASVDFVVAGQAFHWFDATKARAEFVRILKAHGYVSIIWNERLLDTTPFLRNYEALLRKFGTDYDKVSESYPRKEKIEEFFAPNTVRHMQFPNFQAFDFAGLAGRLRSSSYAPKESHANYAPMMAALRELFDAHQENGAARMEYITQVYVGQLDRARNSA